MYLHTDFPGVMAGLAARGLGQPFQVFRFICEQVGLITDTDRVVMPMDVLIPTFTQAFFQPGPLRREHVQ